MSKLVSFGTANTAGASAAALTSKGLTIIDGAGGAQQGLAPDAASAHTTVRHVLVHITGNRAIWYQRGTHAAVWQVDSERAASIFGGGEGPGGEPLTNPALTDRLSRALIRKVTVLETNTNIDEVVAVDIEGLPPKEFTANGTGCSLFVTGPGRVTQPHDVFVTGPNTENGIAWMRQYPRYTIKNIDDEGIMTLLGTSYHFVHHDHPVIHVLQLNQDHLGVHVHEDNLFENRWYKIDTEILVLCLQALREHLHHNTPSTFDLRTLTVRIAKPDGQPWLAIPSIISDSLVPEELRASEDFESVDAARLAGIRRYLDRPLHLTMRIAIEYVLPDASAPLQIAGAPVPVPGGAQPGGTPLLQQHHHHHHHGGAAASSSSATAAATLSMIKTVTTGGGVVRPSQSFTMGFGNMGG